MASSSKLTGTSSETSVELADRYVRRFDFWSHVVEYCKEHGRGDDIASHKPAYND